jgi:4-amino-4-deoxy-L-arabinose transferase-like glycosyltransferase
MEIEFKTEYIPLVLIFFIGIVYIYLASTTQMLGEDEATYLSLAEDFMNGKFTLFTKSGSALGTPPLMPLMYIPFLFLFGSTLAVSKAVTALFGVLTLLMIYLLGKKFGWTASLTSSIILLSIPMFTQFMLISYVEVPIAFFASLSLYLMLQLDSMKKAVLTGFVLGLSYYVKYSGFFLAIGFALYSIIKYFYKRDVNLKFVFVVCAIFALIILPWIIKNIIVYNYPILEGVNLFFKIPPNYLPQWLINALSAVSQPIDYYQTFGYLSIILGIFGAVYVLLKKEEKLYLPLFLFVLFLLLYAARSSILKEVGDPRYFSIVFPYLAIIGGFFLNDVYKKNKNFMFVIIPIVLVSLYFSFSIALSTNSSQRYPQNYIDAMLWLKANTPKDANIFTAYSGSLKQFADRDNVWTINEFPELMTTQNSTYIYDTLRSYNVSYILVWKGIVADRYIIPESNLLGAFTYNFVNVANSDKQHFNATYQNQDNIIFKLT